MKTATQARFIKITHLTMWGKKNPAWSSSSPSLIFRFISLCCFIFTLHCSRTVFHLFHGPVADWILLLGRLLDPPPHRCLAPIHQRGSQAVQRPTAAPPWYPPGLGAAAEAPAGAPPKVGHYQMTDSFISGVGSGRMLEGPSGWWSGGSREVRRYGQVGGDGWCCRELGCQLQLSESEINNCFFAKIMPFSNFRRVTKKKRSFGWILTLSWHLWPLTFKSFSLTDLNKNTAPFRPHLLGIKYIFFCRVWRHVC